MAGVAGTRMRNPRGILTMSSVLAASTPEGSLVILSTTLDNTVILPAGSSPTVTPLFGLLFTTSSATADQPIEVVTAGVFPGIAGGTIASGDEVTSNGTDGTIKSAGTITGGTNCAILGVATESVVSGERCAVKIGPYIRQG
jgi:hypothetical protein